SGANSAANESSASMATPTFTAIPAAAWSSARRVRIVEGFNGRMRWPLRLFRIRGRLSRYRSTLARRPSGNSFHLISTSVLIGGSMSRRCGQSGIFPTLLFHARALHKLIADGAIAGRDHLKRLVQRLRDLSQRGRPMPAGVLRELLGCADHGDRV